MSGKVQTTERPRIPALLEMLTWPPFIMLALMYVPNTYRADFTTLPRPEAAIVWGSAWLTLILSFVAHTMRWERVALYGVLIVAALTVVSTINKAASLVQVLHVGQTLDGWALLENGVTVWLDNVLVFSLLYWAIDRGGPEARRLGALPGDWLFPEASVDPKRMPNYVDYLCLAFNTAAAFGPTDVMTLSTRARALMALESGVALATFAVVGAHAVGILS